MIDKNTNQTLQSIASGDTPTKVWRPLREVVPVDTTVDTITQLQRRVQSLETSTEEIVSQTPVVTPTRDPIHVDFVSAEESPYKTPSGQLVSLVTVDFVPNADDVDFAGVEVWFTGYNGSNVPQLMASGNSSPVQFLCETTHEEVIVTVVAYHADNKTADFDTAPITTVSLDGVSSAPPAPTIAQAQVALPGNAGWQFAFNVLGGLTSDLVDGYWIYHSNVNVPPTKPAGRYQYIKQSSTNVGSVTVQENTKDILFYWVSAVNIGGQESALTAVPFTYIDQGNPSPPSPTQVNTTKNYYPVTVLNGWGPSGHKGNYEGGGGLGSEVFGFDSGTTQPFTNPANVYDGSDASSADGAGVSTHKYYGCVWGFSGISTAGGTTVNSLKLRVLSECFTVLGRPYHGHGDIWYSTDGGATWTAIYKSYSARFKQYDEVVLPTVTNLNNIQVMAFLDTHDDAGLAVHNIALEVQTTGYNGPEKVTGAKAELSSGNVLVSFNALVPTSRTDIATYEIYRALKGNGYKYSVLKNTITPNGAASYSWSDPSSHDATFEYYVLAKSTAGDYSAPSDVAALVGAGATLYSSGASVDSLMPAEAGADTTSKRAVTLIDNPSFESGDTSWGKQAGWTIINDPTNARRGSYVAKQTAGGTSALTNSKQFPVTAGDRVVAYGFVKALAGSNGAAYIRIAWFDANNSNFDFSTGNNVVPTTTYAQTRVVATAPSGAVSGRVEFVVGGCTVGAWFADDASGTLALKDVDINALAITNGPKDAGAESNVTGQGNLVYNGGFELGDIRNWDGTNVEGTEPYPINPPALITDPTAREGAYGGHWNIAGAVVIPSKLIPVNTTKRYVIEARIWQSLNKNFCLGFECFDGNKNHIASGGTAFSYALANNVVGAATWTVYRAVVTGEESGSVDWTKFRAGTKYIKPVFLPNYSGAGTNDAYLDYFKVVEIDTTITNHPRVSTLDDTGALDFSPAHRNKNLNNIADGANFYRSRYIPTPLPTSEVYNGSFEIFPDTVATPDGWEANQEGAPPPLGTISRSASAKLGSYAVTLNNATGPAMIVGRPMAVKASANYLLSAWAKSTVAATNTMYIRVHWYKDDLDFTPYSTSHIGFSDIVSSGGVSAPNTYEAFSGTVTAPAVAKYARAAVYNWTGTSNAMTFDLVQVTLDTPIGNILPDGTYNTQNYHKSAVRSLASNTQGNTAISQTGGTWQTVASFTLVFPSLANGYKGSLTIGKTVGGTFADHYGRILINGVASNEIQYHTGDSSSANTTGTVTVNTPLSGSVVVQVQTNISSDMSISNFRCTFSQGYYTDQDPNNVL